MAKNFKDLQEKMPPEARARAEAKARKMLSAMALNELRVARQMTQEHLAARLKISQASISKMERRADIYVSTLQHTIKAMGGRLEILAIFPEGPVRIRHFSKLS